MFEKLMTPVVAFVGLKAELECLVHLLICVLPKVVESAHRDFVLYASAGPSCARLGCTVGL